MGPGLDAKTWRRVGISSDSKSQAHVAKEPRQPVVFVESVMATFDDDAWLEI